MLELLKPQKCKLISPSSNLGQVELRHTQMSQTERLGGRTVSSPNWKLNGTLYTSALSALHGDSSQSMKTTRGFFPRSWPQSRAGGKSSKFVPLSVSSPPTFSSSSHQLFHLHLLEARKSVKRGIHCNVMRSVWVCVGGAGITICGIHSESF